MTNDLASFGNALLAGASGHELAHQGELTEQVENIISELDEAVQIEWQYAVTVEISSPIVQQLCAELGLTDEQVQVMFDEASKL